MSHESAEMENVSLGEYLRETRINLGLDLAKVARETRIPPSSLQAIEENDFAALPAEAFSRGFYVLYAKMLSLNPEEILQLYMQEKPNQRKSKDRSMLPPHKLAQEVGNMAERPTFVPFSFIGLILLLLLVFGGFLCWYFSWNPATFLSQKLRSLEQNPQRFEQVLESRYEPEISKPRQNTHRNLFDLSSPSTATAAVIQREMFKDFPSTASQSGKYFIHAEFSEKTNLTVAIDDLPERTLLFKAGASATWQASEKAVITLPTTTGTKLSLNDVPLDLPQQHNGSITLSLPEHILQ